MSPLVKYGWHEWLCHTNFSFLIGASHPHEYLQRAVEFGYLGLGVTDYNGVYGLARMHIERRRLMAKALDISHDVQSKFKLTHGMELHLAPDQHLPIVLQDTIVLVAKSQQAYAQLCRMSTYAHRHGKHTPYVTLNELLQNPLPDVVAIQPMRGLLRRQDPGLQQRYTTLREHFSGRFYLAISRHLSPVEDVWIKPSLALAKELNLPCLLSQDAFFHAPEQKPVSDLLQAIRHNKTLHDAIPQMFVNNERCLHSLNNLDRRFRDLPIYHQALADSRHLWESCSFDMSELRYYYPKEMIPESHTAQSFLEQTTWQMACQHYTCSDVSGLPPAVQDILMRELNLISVLGFADYFLTVWDIVRWARSQNILCQGRGSAANSAVCFVLGITSVDPAHFDLLFERFMSVERGDPPDIDVDFEHERREEVIQYIYRRYGRERAAMVANVITFRSRGALRAVGKALGIPDVHLRQASAVLKSRHSRQAPLRASVANLDASMPNVQWQLWADMAQRLRGFPRHLGLHSGGFVLADRPLCELMAYEPATKEGRTVVQWCKEDIEGLGFFKIDILALGMLTAIRKSFAAIAEHYGPSLRLSTVPADDPATYAMIQRADTVGTFQIESRAQMSMLPRLRPKVFYDLVVEVAIIRPGPIQGGAIHPYLRRREGLEAIDFPDERLRPILTRTLGIPIFQEQLMRIAMAVGGFSPGEANELRRNLGAFNMKGDLGPWLTRLAEGMRSHGLQDSFIEGILGQMRGFSEYGFPESHSVSFALLAYVSSYLKCHYPAAFTLGLLNSQPMGFYPPHTLLQVAQRDGVAVLPICIQKSQWDCSLESLSQDSDTEPYIEPCYGLRLGLRYVNGLRQSAARHIERQRQMLGGSFCDMKQFLHLVPMFRPDLSALAAANALSCFGLDRRSALWVAEAAPFYTQLEDVEDKPSWMPESSLETVQQDFAASSIHLGTHPAKIIRQEHWVYPLALKKLVLASALQDESDGQAVYIFGIVLVRQSPPTAKGVVFITLEDETGFINLFLTPQVYSRFHALVESQAFLCVRGQLQKRNESHSVVVSHILQPIPHRAEVIHLPEQIDAIPKNELEKELFRPRHYM